MNGPLPRLHLPFAHWPAADRLMWQQAVRQDDPFSDYAGGRLAKTTLHKLWMIWRRFLGFLTITEPATLEKTPDERLVYERVRQFSAHLAKTNTPYSLATQIDALYGAARIMMPEKDWSWLRTMKSRLYAAAPGPSRSAPVITSVQLVDLGLDLIAESDLETDQVRMADALRYRDGLMIALIGLIPLRHKNFAAIEIGRDLVKDGEIWSIIIAPEETKTNVAIDFEIPEELQPHLTTYISRVRLRLLRQRKCNALWISAKGGVLSYSAVGPVITRHTTSRLGLRIAPHDARDAAATMWAIIAPEQVGISRDLLAHADLRTTTKHYNRAKGIEASRSYAQIIAGWRTRRKLTR
jgi:integrase/recombinase XerD